MGFCMQSSRRAQRPPGRPEGACGACGGGRAAGAGALAQRAAAAASHSAAWSARKGSSSACGPSGRRPGCARNAA
jgi:hypothetical protein